MITYTESLAQLATLDPEMHTSIFSIKNLEGILDWAKQTGRLTKELDIVAQDEYCHDLILRYDDRRWLSFAMT